MKIIQVDNFAREDQPEHLVAENITNDAVAKVLIGALEDTCSDNGPVWYRLVEDDHRLARGMVDIVGEPDEKIELDRLEEIAAEYVGYADDVKLGVIYGTPTVGEFRETLELAIKQRTG